MVIGKKVIGQDFNSHNNSLMPQLCSGIVLNLWVCVKTLGHTHTKQWLPCHQRSRFKSFIQWFLLTSSYV